MHAGAQDGVVRLWGAPRGSLHLWQPSECWSADVPPVGLLLLAPPLLWSSSSSGQTLVLCLLCWPSTAWAACASSLMPSSLLHCALEHSCQPLLSYHASLSEARAWGQIHAATQANCGVGHPCCCQSVDMNFVSAMCHAVCKSFSTTGRLAGAKDWFSFFSRSPFACIYVEML